MGWESIADFKGAQLLGPDQRARLPRLAASTSPRNQILAKIQYYALDGLDHRRAGDGRDRGRPGREADRGLRPGRRQGQPDHQPDPRRLGDGDADPPGDDRGPRPAHRACRSRSSRRCRSGCRTTGTSSPVWQQQLALLDEDPGLRGARRRAPRARRGRQADVGRPRSSSSSKKAMEKPPSSSRRWPQPLGMGNAAAPQGPPSPPSLPNAAGHARLRRTRTAPGDGPGRRPENR